eukprot:SAG22_NODE_10362_length_539_cov_1.163636_3_plen_47_part_01
MIFYLRQCLSLWIVCNPDQISSMYAEPCFNRKQGGTVAAGGGGQFGA